jgi:hypothetical protein
MLFTGDAFELTNGIEKMINWNDARKLTADNTTLTQFGFSTKPQMISSNGNLMHWLSGDETTNQKIHVDVLKVPHHGSQVTTEPILFYHVSASVYLISGSSPTHGYPTVQLLDMIVKSVWEEEKLVAASAPSGYRWKKTQSSRSLPDISQVCAHPLLFCQTQIICTRLHVKS